MKPALITAIALVLGLALPALTWAKGLTMKIQVRSVHLVTPLEITDQSILRSFNIWNGPGVKINNQAVHMNPDRQAGAFVDWLNGEVVNRPLGLQRYEVVFHIGRQQAPLRQYVVFYEFDPAQAGGYIYLPDRTEESGRTNTSLIYHGVEGKWFHSSSAWEKLVRPLVKNN